MPKLPTGCQPSNPALRGASPGPYYLGHCIQFRLTISHSNCNQCHLQAKEVTAGIACQPILQRLHSIKLLTRPGYDVKIASFGISLVQRCRRFPLQKLDNGHFDSVGYAHRIFLKLSCFPVFCLWRTRQWVTTSRASPFCMPYLGANNCLIRHLTSSLIYNTSYLERVIYILKSVISSKVLSIRESDASLIN